MERVGAIFVVFRVKNENFGVIPRYRVAVVGLELSIAPVRLIELLKPGTCVKSSVKNFRQYVAA